MANRLFLKKRGAGVEVARVGRGGRAGGGWGGGRGGKKLEASQTRDKKGIQRNVSIQKPRHHEAVSEVQWVALVPWAPWGQYWALRGLHNTQAGCVLQLFSPKAALQTYMQISSRRYTFFSDRLRLNLGR